MANLEVDLLCILIVSIVDKTGDIVLKHDTTPVERTVIYVAA
jgi:hypothetical protein